MFHNSSYEDVNVFMNNYISVAILIFLTNARDFTGIICCVVPNTVLKIILFYSENNRKKR